MTSFGTSSFTIVHEIIDTAISQSSGANRTYYTHRMIDSTNVVLLGQLKKLDTTSGILGELHNQGYNIHEIKQITMGTCIHTTFYMTK